MQPMLILSILATLSLVGCGGNGDGEGGGNFDPDALTHAIFAKFDTNSDGTLAGKELQKAAPLAAIAKKDEKVTREMVREYLAMIVATSTNQLDYPVKVTYQGEPLAEAKLIFRPIEPLKEIIQPATGTTQKNGTCMVRSKGKQGLSPGFYWVNITSKKVKLPTTYNTETILGDAVSSAPDGDTQGTTFLLD